MVSNIIEFTFIAIIVVAFSTVLYRVVPFRTFGGAKPKFLIFPKYIATYSCSLKELKSNLDRLEFIMNDNGIYSRGKIYGDFSAKAIKLSVCIDDESKELKVFASYFGILFDTGDIWQVTNDIVNA